jgi:hypothetical protein
LAAGFFNGFLERCLRVHHVAILQIFL